MTDTPSVDSTDTTNALPATQPTAQQFELLANRLADATDRLAKAERRFRVVGSVLLGAITIAIALPFLSPALAQSVPAQTGTTLLESLVQKVAALETKTAPMNLITDPNTQQPTVRFTDVNVQIVSGTGSTADTANGRGNLILGYNETRSPGTIPEFPDGTSNNIDIRSGSHCLVIGSYNNYYTQAGLICGSGSTIGGEQGAVAFGLYNRAFGKHAVVTGGQLNTASGESSAISSGYANTASAWSSSISGGYANIASGKGSSVSGGMFNTTSGELSAISGGRKNTASGGNSAISGGDSNTAIGAGSSVSGGASNKASGRYSTISGGSARTISTESGWVAGKFTGTSFVGHFSSP